ncbi:MAG: anthranilate phosphoribosyltransferase [Acidimicrobiales bacterium]|nr:anthranilate phosphoribosyltransferase [Acidimicrobiales bacterium]
MPEKKFESWSTVLGDLAEGRDLDALTTESALFSVLQGEATDAQLSAFVVALRQKGETVDELSGLVRAMRSVCIPIKCPPETVDLVGAGGSTLGRKAALNVSTIASFVAAGAGAKVCKHGNRKASSTSGSFDLLEELSITAELTSDQVSRCVEVVGVGFAYARSFHPAMRYASKVRAELGIPTVFNLLGPLSHPALLKRQVIGVPVEATGMRMAEVLKTTGTELAMVVTGDGGLDELSVTGPNTIHTVTPEGISTSQISPEDVGLKRASEEEIFGGDAKANAQIALQIFDGEPGPKRDIISLNASAGLVVAGIAENLLDGLERANAAIDSGAALQCLKDLQILTKEMGDSD